MSNNQFLSEPPWPKIERSENNFKIAEEEEVAKIFEPKSWEPPIEVVPLESTSQEPEDPRGGRGRFGRTFKGRGADHSITAERT